MYNYDFKKEKVIYEKHNVFAEINNKELFVNIVVTDKNLLLFYNTESDFVTMKSRGIFVTPSYELLFKLDLENISYEVGDHNTYINNDEIILYDFVLKKE